MELSSRLESTASQAGMLDREDDARPRSREAPAWLHLAFLAVCFFLAAHDFKASTFNVLDVEAASETYAATAGSGTITRQLAFVLLGLYGFWGLRELLRNRLRTIGIGGLCATALLLWTLLSATWAITPGVVLSRLVGVVAVTLAAVRIRLRFSARQIIVGITTIGVIFLWVGLFCEMALGTFRPWTTEYRFSGTMSPTEEGVNCSITLLGAFFLWRDGSRRRLWAGVLVFTGILSLLTKARSATLGAVLALVYFYVSSRGDWKQRWLIVASVVSALVFGLLLQMNDLFSFTADSLQFGRDPSTSDNATLTGRIPLWAELMNFAQLHPVAGAGFGGFWISPTIVDISADQGWAISAAHSAYVDVLLSLGGVGLGLYCLSLIFGMAAAKTTFRADASLRAAFFGALLMFVAIGGLTDSESVYVSSSLFFCFVLSLLMVAFRREPIFAREKQSLPLQPSAELTQAGLSTGLAIIGRDSRKFPG